MGLGDLLTQAALVSPANKPFRYGTGLRVLWPTASEQQMGSGKYQLVPLAGFSFSLRSLSDGSFFQFAWREPFSVGGDENRKDIHNSVLNPALTVSLPRQFYVMSSPDITVHWAQGGKWFVPFNLSAGKKFGKRMIFSLEWDQAVVKEYREYDWQIEARIGYFF